MLFPKRPHNSKSEDSSSDDDSSAPSNKRSFGDKGSGNSSGCAQVGMPNVEFQVYDDRESCPVLDQNRRVMTELNLQVS